MFLKVVSIYKLFWEKHQRNATNISKDSSSWCYEPFPSIIPKLELRAIAHIVQQLKNQVSQKAIHENFGA